MYPVTYYFFFFFFNDTATTEIYTLSLHDALPIFSALPQANDEQINQFLKSLAQQQLMLEQADRSEEHTSELQSLAYLVCRLLLEKKKRNEQTAIFLYILTTDSNQSL